MPEARPSPKLVLNNFILSLLAAFVESWLLNCDMQKARPSPKLVLNSFISFLACCFCWVTLNLCTYYNSVAQLASLDSVSNKDINPVNRLKKKSMHRQTLENDGVKLTTQTRARNYWRPHLLETYRRCE